MSNSFTKREIPLIKVDLISVFSATTQSVISEARERARVAISPLMSLLSIFREINSVHPFSLTVTQTSNGCFERYSSEVGEYTVIVKIDSYGVNKLNPNSVKHPCTVLQINKLIANLENYECDIASAQLTPYSFILLSELPLKAFNLVSEETVYQTEFDHGDWNILFTDKKNRCNAEISILTNAMV
jgi:hypothetical protein